MVKEVRDSKSACKTMGYPEVQKGPSRWRCASAGHIDPIKSSANDGGNRLTVERSKSAGPSRCTENLGQSELVALPARILPRQASAHTVHVNQLSRAGLQPVYIYQSKYGKVPAYLAKRMKKAAAEDERRRAEEIRNQMMCQYVPREERAKVLEVNTIAAVRVKHEQLLLNWFCFIW